MYRCVFSVSVHALGVRFAQLASPSAPTMSAPNASTTSSKHAVPVQLKPRAHDIHFKAEHTAARKAMRCDASRGSLRALQESADLSRTPCARGGRSQSKRRPSPRPSGRALICLSVSTSQTMPHLHWDWAHPCRVCTGARLTPAASAPGLGSLYSSHLLWDRAHTRLCRLARGVTSRRVARKAYADAHRMRSLQ